jgi:hypothetical protein
VIKPEVDKRIVQVQMFSSEPRPFRNRDPLRGSTAPPGILYRIFTQESRRGRDKRPRSTEGYRLEELGSANSRLNYIKYIEVVGGD